jgi:hypothetical protein
MADFKAVAVGMVDGQPKLQITFADGKTVHIPLSEQVALVLNAGGWMMREHAARVLEADQGMGNAFSERLRQIPTGGIKAEGARG